jgi:quinol monooxygenase YgiN
MADMIHVATYVDIQPQSASNGVALLQQYREPSHAEEGNSSVEVLREISRPNRFVVVDVWQDTPSFERHETAPHTVQFRSGLKAIHNSPYDQRVHHVFSAGLQQGSVRPETFYLVTHVDVPPPRREETEVLLKILAEQSRSDEGNVRYDVFQQNAPRTNHFTVLAAWDNEKAFASHEMKLHTRQFREALGPMLGAPYDERWYKRLY